MINLTPEQIEKTRVEFKSFMCSSTVDLFAEYSNGVFQNELIQRAWIGWLRRQQTLTVKLPNCETRGESIYQQKIIESLEKSGINYNQE